MNTNSLPDKTLSRRKFLLGGTGFLEATTPPYCFGQSGGQQVTQGTIREIALEARSAEIGIAPGRTVTAWTYNGKFSGPEIRVKAGERMRVTVKNNLPGETSIHWHRIHQTGMNDMDGVPGVTQVPIPAGDGMEKVMGIWHPMHLHGHEFQVINRRDTRHAQVKDTVLIRSTMHGRSEFEFLANNPGDWLIHCHHAYHLAAGMECVFKHV